MTWWLIDGKDKSRDFSAENWPSPWSIIPFVLHNYSIVSILWQEIRNAFDSIETNKTRSATTRPTKKQKAQKYQQKKDKKIKNCRSIERSINMQLTFWVAHIPHPIDPLIIVRSAWIRFNFDIYIFNFNCNLSIPVCAVSTGASLSRWNWLGRHVFLSHSRRTSMRCLTMTSNTFRVRRWGASLWALPTMRMRPRANPKTIFPKTKRVPYIRRNQFKWMQPLADWPSSSNSTIRSRTSRDATHWWSIWKCISLFVCRSLQRLVGYDTRPACFLSFPKTISILLDTQMGSLNEAHTIRDVMRSSFSVVVTP